MSNKINNEKNRFCNIKLLKAIRPKGNKPSILLTYKYLEHLEKFSLLPDHSGGTINLVYFKCTCASRSS